MIKRTGQQTGQRTYRLDLGGTQWPNAIDANGDVANSNPNEVMITLSLDGTSMAADDGSDSGPYLRIAKGDYNRMPFPSSLFEGADGCCYLEGSDANDEWAGRNNFAELYRVLKPGARAVVGSCGCFMVLAERQVPNPAYREDDYGNPIQLHDDVYNYDYIEPKYVHEFVPELNYDEVQRMLEAVVAWTADATRAGFEVEVEYENRGDDPSISVPWFTLTKASDRRQTYERATG